MSEVTANLNTDAFRQVFWDFQPRSEYFETIRASFPQAGPRGLTALTVMGHGYPAFLAAEGYEEVYGFDIEPNAVVWNRFLRGVAATATLTEAQIVLLRTDETSGRLGVLDKAAEHAELEGSDAGRLEKLYEMLSTSKDFSVDADRNNTDSFIANEERYSNAQKTARNNRWHLARIEFTDLLTSHLESDGGQIFDYINFSNIRPWMVNHVEPLRLDDAYMRAWNWREAKIKLNLDLEQLVVTYISATLRNNGAVYEWLQELGARNSLYQPNIPELSNEWHVDFLLPGRHTFAYRKLT